MKIPTNRLRSVIGYIREELHDYYDTEEIENFIFYLANFFLGFSRTDLVLKKEDTMSESVLLKFNAAIKDLKKYKPIQYIIGSTEFYGIPLKVNSHVLIPRPETEELVDLIVKESVRLNRDTISILDIGTGSGCIAIALKKNIYSSAVFAIDISEKALELAVENARMNSTEISFILADILQSPTIQEEPMFDVIVSNPPYVRNSEKQSMSKNVLDYEPHLALFVGDTDALLFYKSIVKFADKYLKNTGKLYFEINEDMANQMQAMVEEKGYGNSRIIKDLSGKNRILVCSKF